MLWSLNARTAEAIAAFIDGLGLPARYAAIHVRRGDKRTEAPYTPVAAYGGFLRTLSGDLDVLYVATDDARVVQEVQAVVGGRLRVASSAPASSAGHNQEAFNRLPGSVRYRETVRFMAEFTILGNAQCVMAASPSNVYYLLRVLRGAGNLLDASDGMSLT